MMTRDQIQRWFAAHKGVAHMLNAATRDYIGARCCIANRLVFIGFVLGAQAVEKFMKAVLLVGGKRPGRSHDLASLLARVTPFLPQLAAFGPLLTALDYAYKERYRP